MKNTRIFMLQLISLALFALLLTGQAIPAQSTPRPRSRNSLAGAVRAAGLHQADDTAPATDDDRWDDGFGFAKSAPDYYDKVKAIAFIGKDMYIGGRFEEAGGVHVEDIAKWNGERWSDLNGGVNDCRAYSCYPTVNSLDVQGIDLIAGGNFVHIGGVETNKVARWDGHQWSALGGGVVICHQNDCVTVDSVAVGASNIYAIGLIDTDLVGVGVDVNAQGVTQWDGQGWVTLGGGVTGEGLNLSLNVVATSGGDTYVGGNFQNAGGTSVNNIARWDGKAWQPLGDGITRPGTCTGYWDFSCRGYVLSIATAGTDVYVGGWFSRAGDVEANGVARWDGSTWHPLGSGAIDGTVFAITVHGKEVYAGGDFTEIGGVKANHIAKWDGEKWSAIGSGVDGRVYTIAIRDNEIFVGGKFTKAGGKTAYNFARWVGPVVTPPVLLPQISSISIRRKVLMVTGQRFDDGAKILLNGEAQKTVNDGEHPTTVLVAKKSGKKLKSGDRLQVQNPDGKRSPEFIVTP
jgi:hypothetical protein